MRRILWVLTVAMMAVVGLPSIAAAKSTTKACPSVTVGNYKATGIRVTPNLGCKAATIDLKHWLKTPTRLSQDAKSWRLVKGAHETARGTYETAYGRNRMIIWFWFIRMASPKPPTPTPTPVPPVPTPTPVPPVPTPTPTPTPTPKQDQTISFTSTKPAAIVGGTYAVTANATSGLPVALTLDASSSGCSIAGASVSFAAVGTCVIDANQAGNASYNAAPQASQTVTITKALQTIAITSTTNPVVGGSYTVVATASSGLPVSLSIDSSSKAGACSLNGATVSFTGGGACVIDANEAGNAAYDVATQVQQALTVSLQGQTIKFTSTAPINPPLGATPYTVTASATSNLPVTFSVDSSSTVGACSVSGALVTFTDAGACVIDANQAGNGTYSPAPTMQQPITVALPASNLQIALTVGGQPLAASYPWGSSTSSQTGVASCTDTAGLTCKVTATLDGTAVTSPASISLPTNIAGKLHTILVSATDNAGGGASKLVIYSVTAVGYYGIAFDDGPSPTYTPLAIAALQNQSLPGLIPGPTGQSSHIPATFFLCGGNQCGTDGLGGVQNNGALAQQEVVDGFVIGDHTWDHFNIGDITDTVNTYDNIPCGTETATITPTFTTLGKLTGLCPQYEIEDTAMEIHAVTGVWPQFFRPPYGDYSGNGNILAGPLSGTFALLNTAAADLTAKFGAPVGYSIALTSWSVDSTDSSSPAPASSAAIAIANETVQNGGILLMHDDNQLTVGAISLTINAEAAKGLLPGKLATTTTGVGGPFGSPQPDYYVNAIAP
jgi:peptidoglycan/xylan/chitin deacetylase (PgdA/CDA1 family)